MAEFSPQQLDRLEDLLADLEQRDDLSGLDLEQAVRARAEDYQRVLRASREALALESVPDGLLDAVFAEARLTRASVAARPSAWQRWRRTLLPALALAGTTAAVLWIVSPDSTVDSVGDAGPPPVRTASEKSVGPAGSVAAGTPSAAPPAQPSEPSPVPAEAEKPAAPAPAQSSSKADHAPQKAAAKPAVGRVPEAQAEPALADKDDAWDVLERAEAARKLGDCDSAERLFRRVLDSALNAKSKASAQMGLGLCAERRGLDGSRDLNDAIANDPSLEAVIQRELEASKPNKQEPAPKKKAVDSADAYQQNAFPRD